jgi:integrase
VDRLQLVLNDREVSAGLDRLLRPDPSPATVKREVATPLSAVMNVAVDRGWAKPVRLLRGKRQPVARTVYLTPAEAERLIAAAAPHLQPLIVFLIGTGARASKALELEWRDVDLDGANAILWRTKSGKRRNVTLPPRVVAVLEDLQRRDDRVFLTDDSLANTDNGRRFGGQFKTSFKGALRRAGLDPSIRVHDLRHTYASWHWCISRDAIMLRNDGGWSSITMVERYAKLMPVGLEDEVRRFLGFATVARPPIGKGPLSR